MFSHTVRLLVVLAALALIASSTAVFAGDGQETFVSQKCGMCHSVPQAGITATVKSEKMKGPDLPAAARDVDWLVGYVSREIQLDGKDHKKEFKGTSDELTAIATWLSELKAE